MHETATVGPPKLIPEKKLNPHAFYTVAEDCIQCLEMFNNWERKQKVVLLNTEEYKQSSENNHLDRDIKESIGKVKTSGKQKPRGSCICLLKQEKAS